MSTQSALTSRLLNSPHPAQPGRRSTREGRRMGREPLGFDAGDTNLYRYAFNRPTRLEDPSGRDVIYLLDPNGASGYGHAAVLIGNDQTGWTYYSFGPKKGLGVFGAVEGELTVKGKYKTLDDARRDPALARYKKFVRWKTNADQDTAARQAAEAWKGRQYRATSTNCDNVVHEAATAAGIRYEFKIYPNTTYAGIEEQYKNDRDVTIGPWTRPRELKRKSGLQLRENGLIEAQ